MREGRWETEGVLGFDFLREVGGQAICWGIGESEADL